MDRLYLATVNNADSMMGGLRKLGISNCGVSFPMAARISESHRILGNCKQRVNKNISYLNIHFCLRGLFFFNFPFFLLFFFFSFFFSPLYIRCLSKRLQTLALPTLKPIYLRLEAKITHFRLSLSWINNNIWQLRQCLRVPRFQGALRHDP